MTSARLLIGQLWEERTISVFLIKRGKRETVWTGGIKTNCARWSRATSCYSISCKSMSSQPASLSACAAPSSSVSEQCDFSEHSAEEKVFIKFARSCAQAQCDYSKSSVLNHFLKQPLFIRIYTGISFKYFGVVLFNFVMPFKQFYFH